MPQNPTCKYCNGTGTHARHEQLSGGLKGAAGWRLLSRQFHRQRRSKGTREPKLRSSDLSLEGSQDVLSFDGGFPGDRRRGSPKARRRGRGGEPADRRGAAELLLLLL